MGAKSAKPAAEVKNVYFAGFRETLPAMTGKTVAITGCTSGTGLICARVCAELGAEVLMLNRSSSRAEAALASLQRDVPGCRATLVPCDLMSFASVRSAAERLRHDLSGKGGLDILCNNAGVMGLRDEATEDGCDIQMQTNHLSHYLLTAELMPLLEEAAATRGEARVVNHSSLARHSAGEGKKALDDKFLRKNGGNLGGDEMGWRPYTGGRWTRYQQSKLANVVFTYALRDRFQQAGGVHGNIKALVAHPGVSATNLGNNCSADGGRGRIADFLAKRVAQSAEDGSMPLIKCCCGTDVSSGDFYGPAKLTGPATLVSAAPEEAFADEASRRMLWEVSAEVTGAAFSV